MSANAPDSYTQFLSTVCLPYKKAEDSQNHGTLDGRELSTMVDCSNWNSRWSGTIDGRQLSTEYAFNLLLFIMLSYFMEGVVGGHSYTFGDVPTSLGQQVCTVKES